MESRLSRGPGRWLRTALVTWLAGLTLVLGGAGILRAAPALVFSEIHYHPVEEPTFDASGNPVLDLSKDVHEFVEIQNLGDRDVGLAGWSLAGGVRFAFPTNAVIPSGGFCVVARDPVRLAQVYGIAADGVFGPYTGVLGNGGDTVRLRDAAGAEIDSVTYSSEFPWAQSADALGASDRFTGLSSTNFQFKGRSLQRVSVHWASNDPANWVASPLSGPTPGSAQASTREIPRPVVVAFTAVQGSDGNRIIRPGQPARVACTFSSTNGLGLVELEYFLDDVNSTSEARVKSAMTPLGDGHYVGNIPGNAARSVVRYRFNADRGGGLETVSPRADDPQCAPVGVGGALEAWHGYFVTPVRTTANAAIHDVLVSTSSLSRMAANVSQSPKRVTAGSANGLPRDTPYVAATSPQWNGTVPAVFASDGRIWDVRMRYHGSRYHRAPSNLSYKVHFPDHEPYNGQTSWFETLHGVEFIEAQKINRLLGVPSSKMRRVDWYLNSAANLVHSEQGEYADEMLSDFHRLQQQLEPGSELEPNGELYKDVGNRDPSQNNAEGPYTRGDAAPILANARWTQMQRYDWTYTLQNHSWIGSKPIRDLIEGMWVARGDTPSLRNFSSQPVALARTKAWFTNHWDMETTLTSMALLEWMSIWDDAAQNHFFWRRADGRWARLGWDYDNVMSTGGGGGGPGGGGGLGGGATQTIYGGEQGAATVFDGVNWWKDTFYKCFRAEYNQRLWELNNSFFDPQNLKANGLTRAATFAATRQTSVNNQLSALGSYSKPGWPVNLFPAAGTSVGGATNLTTSIYTHPAGLAHAATLWEIRDASGDFEEPVFRQRSTNQLRTLPIPYAQLTYGRTYVWRATHIDAAGHPSVVSVETAFTWGVPNGASGDVVLNEILANNRRAVANGADYPDYIELRNNLPTDVNLGGYGIAENPADGAKFTFAAETILPAKGRLVLWCDSRSDAPGLHAGFKLDAAGQTVLLVRAGVILDSVQFGPQAPDVAISRVVDGTGGWRASVPTPGTENVALPLGSASALRVNEWLANPAYGDDWFEIHNSDTRVVALEGVGVTDDPSRPGLTRFPALSFVGAQGYLRMDADGSDHGGRHAAFKLDAAGDEVLLTAADGVTVLDRVQFGTQPVDVAQGRLPDGAENIASFTAHTATPGEPNRVPAPVRISEVLAHSGVPYEDAIELVNVADQSVDVGGWWLSDDALEPRKFAIPSGTRLPAGARVVFYHPQFASGAAPFSPDANGGEIVLTAVNGAGEPTGLGDRVTFGPSALNTSFIRVAATGLGAEAGDSEFWPALSPTFGVPVPSTVAEFRLGSGSPNAAVKSGPVVINEVDYHPVRAEDGTEVVAAEFVELHNLSTESVSLAGWRLRGDSEFVFSESANIAGEGFLLLVGFDPAEAALAAAFRAFHGISADVPLAGPFTPKLGNATHNLELARTLSDASGRREVMVDKVNYRDSAPWPVAADGGGASLQRIGAMVIGNSAASWKAAKATPGAANSTVTGLGVDPTALPGGLVGASYSIVLRANGGAPVYAWNVAEGNVPGLTLAAGGTLAGIPETAGVFSLRVRVTDSQGASAEAALEVVVAAVAPSVTSGPKLSNGNPGKAYEAGLTATGGTTPYTWTLVGGALPTGLSLSPAGVISGVPDTAGLRSFTVQVADRGGLLATRELTLEVVATSPTILTAAPLVDATVHSPYAQALAGAGGVPPYEWSVFSGTLPPGLVLHANGDLDGQPTTAGTYVFVVQLKDQSGAVVRRELGINVAGPGLAVATLVLPDGRVGADYVAVLGAEGGSGGYVWTTVWGGLPDGCVLSSQGVVAGRPTARGTFSVIVEVSDSSAHAAQRLFTVQVASNPPVVAVQAPGDGTIHLMIAGDAGPFYGIEVSADFETWVPAGTIAPVAMPAEWIETLPVGEAGPRYYRVVVDPEGP